jgi:hydrogenase/urease accessory protein HupE
MEFLLLWADNLDDVLGALRHLWPQVVDFFTATLLFAMTGFGLMLATQATVAAVAVLSAAGLMQLLRQRHHRRNAAGVDNKTSGA